MKIIKRKVHNVLLSRAGPTSWNFVVFSRRRLEQIDARCSCSGKQLEGVNPVVAEEAGDTPKHTEQLDLASFLGQTTKAIVEAHQPLTFLSGLSPKVSV